MHSLCTVSALQMENHMGQISHVEEEYLNKQQLHEARWTEQAARSRPMISLERMHWWMHCEIKWGSDPK